MINYPIFLKLGSRRTVIVGAGAVAARKAQMLLAAGAHLVVVAPDIDDMLTALCQGTNAELFKTKYQKNYLAGAVLAIAATNDPQLNKQVYKDCQELGILCNVVDVPELCDFLVPAVVKRDDLQIAIGTGGLCPAYAAYLRKKLEKTFTDKHAEFLAELGKLRKHINKEIAEPANRKVLLAKLVDDKSFEYFVQNGFRQWKVYVGKIISKRQE